MAGPETAFALGQPDLTVDNLGGQPPLAPMTTQAAPTADQLVQGQQQASRPVQRMNIGLQAPQLNPNRAYSSAEFSNEKPWESRASGGDFIATPRGGQIAWGIIADRAAQTAKKKAELEEGMKKMFGGDKFEGQAAPQYEREYQRWAVGEEQRFKQEFADQYYGGNLNAAMKALYKDPAANALYMARMRDVKAAGIANKYYVTQAQDYLDGVRSGQIQGDPEMLRTATEMVSGGLKFSGPNTPSAAQMADKGAQWEKLSSRSKLFNDTVQPRLRTALDEMAQQGKIHSDRSGRLVMDKETFKNYNRLIESTAKEWENLYGIGTEEENKAWLNSNLGQFYEQDTEVLPLGSGGSSRQDTPADKVWTSPVQVNMANTNTGGSLVETVSGDGVKRRTPAVQSISVGNVVDGRQEQFTKPVQFKKGNTPVKMIWTGIDRGADGSIMLVGYDPASTDTDSNVDDLQAEIGDLNAKIREDEKGKFTDETEEAWKARIEGNKKRRSDLLAEVRRVEKGVLKRMVPLKGNEGVADGLLGGRLQQELAKFGAQPSQGPSKPLAKGSLDDI